MRQRVDPIPVLLTPNSVASRLRYDGLARRSLGAWFRRRAHLLDGRFCLPGFDRPGSPSYACFRRTPTVFVGKCAAASRRG